LSHLRGWLWKLWGGLSGAGREGLV
jgi:hypothetical protein